MYLLVGSEELVVATPAVILSEAEYAVTQYGYAALNIREVTTDERLAATGYLPVDTFAELAASYELPQSWLHVYEFDLTAEGAQRTQGDIYILVVIVAGHVVYASWL